MKYSEVSETLAEANCGRATDRGKEGYAKPMSRRTETTCEADGAGELAQHSESVQLQFSGGKCGGCVGEDCVITWGDLPASAPRAAHGERSRQRWRGLRAEVSRGRSKDERAGGRTRPT